MSLENNCFPDVTVELCKQTGLPAYKLFPRVHTCFNHITGKSYDIIIKTTRIWLCLFEEESSNPYCVVKYKFNPNGINTDFIKLYKQIVLRANGIIKTKVRKLNY